MVEMPWWAYGPRGMQLWFPSLLQRSGAGRPGLLSSAAPPAAATATTGTDIELEFDQEVYPVGISLADAAIVGATQRVVRGGAGRAGGAPGGAPGGGTPPASSLPCFFPVPESQPVLPCLLRRLLQQGAFTDALLLANKHQRGPHFARSLEWLLFTALEAETTKPAAKRTSYGMYRTLSDAYRPAEPFQMKAVLSDGQLAAKQAAAAQAAQQQAQQQRPHSPGDRRGGAALPIPITPLLNSAAELVRSFAQFADVVVSVARKTDASLWPALFTAVGSPSVLLEGLLEAGALRSAACFLLVVDRLEGAPAAHALALRLIRASLRQGQYFLCAEILRFIVPPGEMDTFLGMCDGGPAEQQQQQQQRRPEEEEQQQQQQQQQQPAGGGYLSWLSWFWGGSASAPEPPKPEEQQAAAAAALQASGARPPERLAPHSSAAARQRGASAEHGTYTASAAPARRDSAPDQQQAQQQQQEGGGGGGGEGITPGVHACQLVADHAWALLDQGQLGALAQLHQAMAFLSGGLLRLMRAFTDPLAAVGGAGGAGGGGTSAVDLLSALSSAVRELPVWESEAVEHNALRVLELCGALHMEAWTLAVGVLLVDMAVVLPFREAQPGVWQEFAEQLRADGSFYFLHEIVDVLSSAPAPGGAALQQVEGAAQAQQLGEGPAGAAGLPAPVSREIQVAED